MVGPWGLLQSFADFLKYIVKEVVVPAGADRAVFFLAPLISFSRPCATVAVSTLERRVSMMKVSFSPL